MLSAHAACSRIDCLTLLEQLSLIRDRAAHLAHHTYDTQIVAGILHHRINLKGLSLSAMVDALPAKLSSLRHLEDLHEFFDMELCSANIHHLQTDV